MFGDVIAQEARGASHRANQQIEIAVVVVVGQGRAAADVGSGKTGTQSGGNIDKFSGIRLGGDCIPGVGLVAQNLVSLGITKRRVDLFHDVEDVAVGDEEIEVAVQIDIEEFSAKTEGIVAGLEEADLSADIGELALAVVVIERVGLVGEIGNEQVLVAVVIPVAKVHAHAGFGAAVLIVAAPGRQTCFDEVGLAVFIKEV